MGRSSQDMGADEQKEKDGVDGKEAPDRNEEYLLYQTIIGVWPLELLDGAVMMLSPGAFRIT